MKKCCYVYTKVTHSISGENRRKANDCTVHVKDFVDSLAY